MDLDLFEVTNVEPRHRAIAERAGLWDAVEEILGRPVPEYEAMESTPGFCRWDGKPLPHLFEVETKRGRKPSYCPPPDDPQEKSCELQWRTRDRRQRRTHDTAVRADLHLRVVDAIIYLDRELVPVLEAIEPDAVPEGRTFQFAPEFERALEVLAPSEDPTELPGECDPIPGVAPRGSLDGFDDWAEEYDVIDPAHLKLHQREEEQDLSVDEVLALDPDELDRYLTASKSESSLRSYVQDLRKAQRKAVKAAAKAAA